MKGRKKKRERKKTPTAQRRREEEYQRTEKLGQETKHNISRKLVALSAPILSTRNDDDRPGAGGAIITSLGSPPLCVAAAPFNNDNDNCRAVVSSLRASS